MTAVDFTDIARRWLLEMQASVRTVDYARARHIFAEDVVAFGTYAEVVTGVDALQRDQWQHIWPTIREFTFRLDQVRCLGDEHALCVVAPWDSVGVRTDGTTFPRPGRATLVLEPRGGRWLARHSHFSLAPRP